MVIKKIFRCVFKGNTDLKQVIVVRTDLKLSKGKLAAQVGHAAVSAALRSPNRSSWVREGQKKSVLKCGSLDELIKLKEKADNLGLTTAIIEDAGRTQIPSGTITCLGIGPDEDARIDKVTGELKLL